MDIVTLIQLGGLGALAAIMTLAARSVFEAWQKGTLVPRTIWERAEARSDVVTVQLERNNDTLVKQTATMARMATALERRAKADEALARDVHELLKLLRQRARDGGA
jgi:hypothetical protein